MGDIFVLNRDFRDVVALRESKGYTVLMSALKGKKPANRRGVKRIPIRDKHSMGSLNSIWYDWVKMEIASPSAT